MAYVPYAPTVSIPSPGALAGTTSGTITTFDISPELNVIALQLGQISYYLAGGAAGVASGTDAGSLPLMLSAQVDAITNIMQSLNVIANKQDNLTTAITQLTSNMGTSMATVASLMSQMVVTQQLAVADQIHNNEFQQQVTNTSRTEAGLSEITVSSPSLTSKISSSVTNIGTIQSEVAASSAILGAVTSAGTQALSYATTWLGSTAIGSWFVSQYSQLKASVLATFGTQQATNDTSTAAVVTANKLKNPTSAVTPQSPINA